MQEPGLIGLEARAADGTEVGRIAEILTDEQRGEVTHVIVETEGGERLEVPITNLSLDPDADFATFAADASDVEPGDHTDDEVEPEDYAESVEDLQTREDWEDESYTADSGYPRNDVYVDPDTGEERVDPALKDNDSVEDDVADLLDGTNVEVRSFREGVVTLTGAAASREDLQEIEREVMGLDEILEIDDTDVDVG